MLFKGIRTLLVSASGFRGGKLLFEDAERLFFGQLSDQRRDGEYLERSVHMRTKKKMVRREPDRWVVEGRSHSTYMTLPSNNEEALRGVRAHETIVDERNTFDGEVVQKVIRPMMNVGQRFRKTAGSGISNKMFQVSTIDYTFRDWYPEIDHAWNLARREYEAQRARKHGDWKEYERLLEENDSELKTASFAISQIDYTDLLIPDMVHTDRGSFKVDYPLPDDLDVEDVLAWDERDKTSYWYTYPVDKHGLEEPLRNGTMDEELWMAEQRNIFIATSGNVYPFDLIQKQSERPIYREGEIKGYEGFDEFFAPAMYECGDPCVMGVDYARENDEFAVVVIRLGELAEGEFDPTVQTLDEEGRPCLGETSWNHVIWAESWKKWTAAQAAELIRDFKKRYNLVAVAEENRRAIGMDKGGGGTAVRDNLAQPKPPVTDGIPDPYWEEPVKIFDPEDDDYAHYSSQNKPGKYWGGLELIKATNQSNLEATMGSKALLQQAKLFIAFWQPDSRWAVDLGLASAGGKADPGNPDVLKWKVGYNGIRRLKAQLVRVQTKVTETNVIRFVMPGDREREEGKKDLYSAFIYAAHMARQHLVALTKDQGPPQVKPILVNIGGAKSRDDIRSYRRIGWRP
jgi:hypothetical protein